jgi:hypothetical protein
MHSRHCDPEPRYLEEWESGREWRVQVQNIFLFQQRVEKIAWVVFDS